MRGRCFRVLDSLFDAVTISVSVVDILTDILVAHEFYVQERFGYFYASIAIFFLAQISYAVLATATWGSTKGPLGKIVLFFGILPFGQLVPFVTWLSFSPFCAGFFRKCMAALGLQSPVLGNSDADSTDDSLWVYIQRKYQAHAGFLAEAFVEAIPQCLLQVAAVMTSEDRTATPLNVASIVLSVVVVSSKGYMVSFSIHRKTFIFNVICLACDCFGLFATGTWVFSLYGSQVLEPWLVKIGLASVSLSGLAGFFLVLFTIFDDHVKSRSAAYPEVNIKSKWFHLYLVRLLCFAVGVVPVTVVILAGKLAAFPLLLFHSLDPEHAMHSEFYKSLFFGFLLQGSKTERDLKVFTANRFFSQARKDVKRLQLKTNKQQLVTWLLNVGLPKEKKRYASPEPAEGLVEAKTIANRVIAASVQEENLADLRKQVRWLNLEEGMSQKNESILLRSAVLKSIIRGPCKEKLCTLSLDSLLQALGLLCFVFFCVTMVCWLPCIVAFWLYGFVFPIIELGKNYSSAVPSQHLLAIVLTEAYMVLILVGAVFLPSVKRFQMLRADVVDLSSFPPLFYSMHPAAQATGSRESGEGEGGAFQHLPTIQELCLRFEAECRKRDLYRTVEEASGGPDMATLIFQYWGANEATFLNRNDLSEIDKCRRKHFV